MPTNHSKSTITNNIEEPFFVDASDSFDSILIDDANVNSSIQSAANNYQIPFNLKDIKKSNGKLRSSRVRASSSSLHNSLNEEINDNSAITTVDEDDRINAPDSSVSGSNLLFLLAGLVIKTTWFQFHLLFGSVTLPVWLIYYSYMFMIDPYRSINLAKCYIFRIVSTTFSLCLNPVKWIIHFWIRKHESTLKLCLRIGWGLLWSVYVGFVLSSLFVFALVVSGVILKCVIEEPVRISMPLSFDYTEGSPVAFVPLMSCPELLLWDSSDGIWSGCGAGSRVIPVGHKVRGTVLLTLPESYYNRNLGIFQVRVEFVSGDGKCLFSTRQPSMLRYKSQPMRLLLTFLKLAPLITGHSSESQTLNIKLSGYTEGTVPTSCLRVILEQRAEFSRGAGVPVIYEASFNLESEPPFFKRILWSWKWTIYIWASVMIFVVELLFTVVCCTPIIIPRLQPRRV